MLSRFSKTAFIFIFLLALLGGKTAFAQDDILDQIEAELKAEEEKKKAAEKASKNEEKYKANYEASTRKGEAYLRSKKYDEAIEEFTEAKKWGPLETYPDQQKALAKQEKAKEEEAEKRAKIEAEYKDAITKADELFNSKKYLESIPEYQKAKKIDPEMAYPTDQIAEAKKLQAQVEAEKAKAEAAKKLEEDFKAALDEGDAALIDNAYEKAISSYQKAKSLKPADPIPNARIETAKKTQADAKAKAEQEKIQKEFDDAMSKADALLSAKSYDEAIIAYKDAQKIKPSDPAPKSKITEAENLKKQNAEAAKKEKYEELVSAADDLLKDSQFDAAKEKYGAAAAVMPHETYPKTKIKECEELKVSAAKAELRKQYDALVKAADDLLEKEEFDAAKGKYQEALTLLPNETHPKTMITEAYSRKKSKAAGEVRAQYDAIIKEADDLVKTEAFDQAIAKYNEAKKIIPTEKHPNDMLLEIEKLKKQKANEALSAKYDIELKKGEELLKEEKFDEAISAFEAAHAIMPHENKTTELITEAKNLKEQKKRGAVQAEFDAKIKEGEGLMQAQEFDQAIAKFNEAAIILPSDNKVKSLIEEAKKEKLAKLDALATEKFNSLIKAGDEALASEDFVTARLKYDEALAVHKAGKNTVDAKLAALAQKEKEKQEQEMAASAAAEKQKKFDGLIAQANSKNGAGDYSGAMTTISSALAIFPDNKEATALKSELEGKIQAEQAKAKEAAALAQAAKEKQAKEEQISQLISDAKQEASQKNYSIALAKIQNALTIDNASAPAIAAKTEIESAQTAFEAEKEQNAEAAAAAEKERKEKQLKITNLLATGGDALANKEFTAAETAFNQVLDIDPSNAAATTKLSELKQLIEEDKLAAEQAEKAKANKEKQAELRKKVDELLAKGNASLNENNFDAALASYNSALIIDPANEEVSSKISEAKSKKLAAENKAKADADAKAAELAAAEAAKTAADREAKINSILSEGNELELAGDLNAAKSKYNEVLSIDANNADAKSKISSIDLKLAKLDQEKRAQEAAANAQKEKAAAESAAAELAQQKAAKEMQIQSLLSQADNLAMQKNYDQAKSKYKEVLAIDNANTIATSKIAEIDSKVAAQNKEQLAKEAAAKAEREKLATESAKKELKHKVASQIAIGDQMVTNKNYADAIGAYRKAIELDPQNSLAKTRISDVTTLISEEENKRKKMNAQERQEEVDAYLNEAKALVVKRDYQQAKSKYDKVLSIDASNAAAENGLAAIKSQLDNLAAIEARNSANKDAELKKAKEVERILDEGYDLFAGGKYDDAIDKFKEGVDIDPTNSEIKQAIHEALEQENRLRMIMLAKKSNRPRPQAKFETENIGGKERTDKKKYQNELGNAYPEGVTETQKEEERKKITKRIVVKEKVGSEYLRISYEWGGTYYFKNGESVGTYIWQYETRDPSKAN
ncbi:hypothetical protein N8085_03625 [Salibacteraceae bacterium]|nr:hypothetical protein [Salibacteraceae bacterium]MDC1204471.1 hypothetical protein [Salibacteraceae bacterium]